MTTTLNKLLQLLDNNQLNQEIIELDFTQELQNLIGSDKVTVVSSGETKNVYFAGLGEVESYTSKIDLIYKNKDGKLVVKPKLIKEFLNTQ
jgi:hypothetical protein